MASAPVIEPWRCDNATYTRMAELGFFEDQRVELLDGVITPMMAMGREHHRAMMYLTRLTVEATDQQINIRPGLTLDLAEGWMPEPDIAMSTSGELRGAPGMGLAIEVAMTSLRRDRDVKLPAYARAGIPEYWIVDLASRSVQRYLEPEGDRYAKASTVASGVVQATRYPRLRLDLQALFRFVDG